MEKKKDKDKDYQLLCDQMEKQGYKREESVLSGTKVSVLGLISSGIVSILFIVLYIAIYKEQSYLEFTYFSFIIQVVISLFIHEILHGLAWKIAGKLKWEDIAFGISHLIPYCHCHKCIDRNLYLVGIVTPIILLGGVPSIAAIILQNPFLLIFGTINILLAGGDIVLALKLVKIKEKTVKVFDHPYKAGFVLFDRK